MRALIASSLAAALALSLVACGGDESADGTARATTPIAPPPPPGVEAIDDARLVAAASEPQSWLTYGGSYAEQRYSTLDKINTANVAQLGFAFSYDTHTTRGLEATPIVAGGVLYTTGSWSKVYAVDAKTGKEIWQYDPEVDGKYGTIACCDVVNRGVAAYKGKIYVGALDGRLIALDAKTGIPVWEKLTVDQSKPYTVTMAPRVIKGKVIIGNGGAELGVRGYVSAYDAETGELVWRFYTVPRKPAPDQPLKGQESAALEKAVDTWTGDTWHEIGGGGTVWDAVAFDPELDLMYVGTGNGSPWARKIRSPGGGDNLYLSSILALRPDTGELAWHYQTTPADNWDYTAVQHILLADLTIDGRPRKVLMQAPKNGFFYVLDRATGELLSADKYVETTWATHVDLKTGRPVESAIANYDGATQTIKPSPLGGHNWQPMSFNPQLGLVYIPANDIAWAFGLEKNFVHRVMGWNTGNDPTTGDAIPRKDVSGKLIAWDPVARKPRWEVPYPEPWNGGTLATAGGLVFQGSAHGMFAALDAATGKVLWETPAGTGVMAAASTYELQGEQYVAVMAGWGGAFGLVGGDASLAANEGAGGHKNDGRLLVFKLGGTAQIPALEKLSREVAAIAGELDPEHVKLGNFAYHRWCAFCHGVGAISGGVLPDLRTSQLFFTDALEPIVLEGQLLAKGMPNLSQWVTKEDVALIRAYITAKRNELAASQRTAPAPEAPKGGASAGAQAPAASGVAGGP